MERSTFAHNARIGVFLGLRWQRFLVKGSRHCPLRANMIPFPHISLFRNVLAYVEHVNTDPEVPKQYRITSPVTFEGSIKLHGSNCGVVWSAADDSLTAQSREVGLTPTKDYKGFAKFVDEHAVQIRTLISITRGYLSEDVRKVALYGEWVGVGVQSKSKGAAVAKFDPKHWALFAAWAVFGDGDPVDVTHLVLGALPVTDRIGNVRQAGNWTLVVDFSDPASITAAVDEAARITASIEAQCPYGKVYGLDGGGEGIVWMPVGFRERQDLYWKHKTEAHSVVKEQKTLRERLVVAEDAQAAIAEFVTNAVTVNRLEQGIDALDQQGMAPLTRAHTGRYIQWVAADVERECALELVQAGLTWKQVSNQVMSKAREFYLAGVTNG